MTFSICAFDAETGELGIAVQSKFLAVGAVVPFARAGVGAIATQSWANTSYGPRGLELLASGPAPEEVIQRLIASLRDLFGVENLEERWIEGPSIDEAALVHLRARYRA